MPAFLKSLSGYLGVASRRGHRTSRKLNCSVPTVEPLEDRTTPTSFVTMTANLGLITDANAPGTLSLRVLFSGSMRTDQAPVLSFPTANENPGSSLVFANGFFATTNTTNDTYVANFATSDQNVNLPNIDVRVTGAVDFNSQTVDPATQADVFSINTQNPVVQSVVVNKQTIVAADSTLNFVVTVTYREAMQTSLTTANTPSITFSQDVSRALTFTSGVWDAAGRTYTATYRIGGSTFANLAIPSININIAGGRNVAGFAQLPFTANNAFAINTVKATSSVFPVGSTNQLTGDFNGDGLTDVAAYYRTNGRWLVALSTGNGFLAPQIWATFTAGTPFAKQIVGDFNNDGKDDIGNFITTSGLSRWLMNLSTGSGFSKGTLWANTTKYGVSGWARHLVGDFNGDGFTDIASFRNISTSVARWYVNLSNGSSAFTTTLWANFSTISLSGWTSAVVGDFNADGKDDIANFFNRSGVARWWVSLSNGTAFTTTLFGSMSTATGWTNQAAGDFNNDGRTDLVSFNTNTNEFWVSLSNGATFTTSWWSTIPQPFGLFQVVADFNGDHKDDLGLIETSSGQIAVGASSGANFAFSVWATLFSTTGLKSVIVNDFNGDGKPDLGLFYATTTSAQWWISINNGFTFTTTRWI